MADYFDKTESPFDFSGTSKPGDISIGKKVDAFTAQIFPNFVKDYGPQQEPIGIAGTPGQKGFFSQNSRTSGWSCSRCIIRLRYEIEA